MPQHSNPITRDFLTVRQAAERIGVAERTILHWISTGELQAEQLDPDRPYSDKLIPIRAIEALEKKRAQPAKD